MNFFALATGYDADEEIFHARILDPKPLRRHSKRSEISFHTSKVHNEEKWQRPYSAKTGLLVGEYRAGGEVTDVKFLSVQQFRGVIQDWDPVHMRATVDYPEIQENHSRSFSNPWLSRGDRIIVEGSFRGPEWNMEDFRFHRRVRTCRLEAGTITMLNAGDGCLITSAHEELEFDVQDVLLCDCRDFYPRNLRLTGYEPDLRKTFDVGERVLFIRAQDEDPDRCAIKVFVPRTEFGLLDPIFDPNSSDLDLRISGRAGSLKSSINSGCDQMMGQEASFPCCLQQHSRTNLRHSSIMKSCPDINACFTR